MERREFLTAAGTVAASAAAIASVNQALAEDMPMAGHAEHKGGIAKSAGHCVSTGEECVAHCLKLFAKGDTTLAQCAISASQLVTVCRALSDLALAKSGYVPAMAKVVLTVCNDCEKECRKYEEHAECKACADACKACAEDCRKLGA